MSKKKKNAGMDPFDGLPVRWETATLARNAAMIYEDWLMSVALARFRWEGLPDTCDERYLEWCLLTEGVATLAVSGGNLYSLMAVIKGAPNMYDNPRSWEALGQTGQYRFPCDWSNGVVVYDNLLRVPLGYKLRYFARRLALCDRTVDVNLMQQHHPMIIAVPQEMQADAESIYRQVADGEPAILGTPMLREIVERITCVKTDAPFIAQGVQAVAENVFSQAYTMLGFDQILEKTERRVDDEIKAETGPSRIMRYNPLRARRDAARKLSRIWDSPVSVYWATDWESANYNYLHTLEEVAEDGSADVGFMA